MAQPATKKTTTKSARSRSTRASKTPPTLKSFNPRTGEVMREIPTVSPGEVADIVAQARKVQPEWAAIPAKARANMLAEVRQRIYGMRDEIVATVAAEAGKPEAEAFAHEVLAPIGLLLGLEKIAPKALKTQKVSPTTPPVLLKLIGGNVGRTEWRPFGVVGAITPWNYPITNCFLGFASALLAGNTVVIKPSEVTPACAEIVRELLEPLPAGVATVIQGGADVGAALVAGGCDKISFIGSSATGRRICEAAAKTLTPVVMELGGKDAAIVCDDADPDLASSGILWGAFFNAGQTCCSIERVYVTEKIADDFKDRLLSKLAEVKQGELLGPLTFKNQLDIVRSQVDDALKKGARLLAGGPDVGLKNEKGSLWYAPTVLEGVSSEMDVLRNESFGPIVTITRVQDEAEAIRRANEEAVNLTASVWTKSSKTADALASQLKAGNISVNQHGESPATGWGAWGGFGESGFGRLNGEVGIREFTVPVHVQKSQLAMKRVWWYPYDEPALKAFKAAAKTFGAQSRRERMSGLRELLGAAGSAIKRKL